MDYLAGIPLICKLIKTSFPAVKSQLLRWKSEASAIGDDTLKAQALSSIEKKRFHCQGGSAYALYPSASINDSVRFIVSFQTISDYLDNLCDRAGVYDESAFRQLHLSMLDAINPLAETHDYYLYYPQKDDSGYLRWLVEECRLQLQRLQSFGVVKENIRKLVSYYIELQVFKHITPSMREKQLTHWAAPLAKDYPDIAIWEFCAAAGSTLGVFLLVAAAQDKGLTVMEADDLLEAYFPWVCGLHILLDYFIDAEEDKLGGDFNFTNYYGSLQECEERLVLFVEQSITRCARLKFAGFHKTVIHGLLAMYLSDPKANSCMNRDVSRKVLKIGGRQTQLYHRICCLLRGMGKL